MNRMKVKRGTELPQAKLDENKVRLILDAVKERNNLKAQLANLSNKALAEYLGVSLRTVDRVTAGENWTHVKERR
jgi:FixJ family two-component response regulator